MTVRELSRKKSITQYLYSWPVITLAVVVFLLLAISTYGVYNRATSAETEADGAKRNLDKLEARQGELEAKVTGLGAEGDGVDEEIRSRYAVAKPGEHVLILTGSTATSDVQAQPKKRSFFQVLRAVFGIE